MASGTTTLLMCTDLLLFSVLNRYFSLQLSCLSGDSFTYHNQSYFSTKDNDNDDGYRENCAQRWTGAWWYKQCHRSNLNGVYWSSESAKGVNWYNWKGHEVSLTGTRMMVKPKP